jgi:hypothetical protein
MKQVTSLFVVTGALALAACASQGGPPAPKPIARDPVAAPATTSANQATTAANTSSDSPKIPYGYQKKIRNGEEVYCRNDYNTGTRVQRSETCLSAAELQREGQDTQDFLQDMQRRGGTTTTTTTPGQGGMLGAGAGR